MKYHIIYIHPRARCFARTMRNIPFLITPQRIFFGILFVLSTALHAQLYTHVYGYEPGWVWLDPMPTGGNHSLFIRTMNGFMVFDNTPTNHGIYTSDKAQTWQEFEVKDIRDSVFYLNTESITFVNDTLGYAFYKTWEYAEQVYMIYQSHDGGFHWATIASLPKNSDSLLIFKMFTDKLGWLETIDTTSNRGYIKSILLTNDSCKTWRVLLRDTSAGLVIDSVDFISFSDSSHGWVAKHNSSVQPSDTLLQTTNGGVTWMNVFTESGGADSVTFANLFFGDSSRGWSVRHGTGHFTTDGGRTWSSIFNQWYLDSMQVFDRITAAGTYSFVAYPKILYNNFVAPPEVIFASTSNNGLEWNTNISPDTDIISSAPIGVVVDDSTAAIVAGDDLLTYTTNRGKSWNANKYDNAVFRSGQTRDIFFLDHHRGFIAGSVGNILSTVDAGRSWVVRQDLSGTRAHAIFENTFVWFAQANSISMSRNAGASFQFISLPSIVSDTFGYPITLAFADSLSGWLGTYNGYILHTTDGGYTWNMQFRVAGLPASVYQICAFGADNALATVSPGVLLHTTNGGANWETPDVECYDEFVPKIIRVTPLHGFVTFDDTNGTFNVIETVDAGATWKTIDSRTFPRSAQFVDSLHGASEYSRTSDGGKTWIYFVDMGKAMFDGGNTGAYWMDTTEAWELIMRASQTGLIHYGAFHDDTLQSAVQEASAPLQPSSADIIINYPNPFSSTTEITFSTAEHTAKSYIASITIYDIFGKEIADISDQYKRTGRAVFDGAALPAGVYFCKGVINSHVVEKTILVAR